MNSIDHLPRTGNLRERRVQEMLLSESWVHRHDQHLVEVLQDFLQHGRRSRRVNGDADPFSQPFDALHSARQIVIALPVDQKCIGSGHCKFIDKEIRVRNHQVRLQRQARHFSQRVDDRWSHREVRHEMPIHHVHVYAVRSGPLSLCNLIAQMGEVGREDRWSKLYCISRHATPLSLR